MKNNTKYVMFAVVGVLILAVVVFMAFLAIKKNQKPTPIVYKNAIVTFPNQKVTVQVADTDPARNLGLSDRPSLGVNDGMLFVFPAEGKFAFWMKDMEFGLDFVWIHNGKVVEITPNVTAEVGVPEAALHTYLPGELIDSVLEVNAGWAATNKVKVGVPVTVSYQ